MAEKGVEEQVLAMERLQYNRVFNFFQSLYARMVAQHARTVLHIGIKPKRWQIG